MTKRKWLLIALGWFSLTGTTPGAIGSCGGDDELSRPAEFQSYCVEREELICVRNFLRDKITAEMRDICRNDADLACARRAFPADCRPTQRETQACLRALSSFDTLDTPDTEIKECRQSALCTATPSEQADAAVGGSGNPDAGSEGDE